MITKIKVKSAAADKSAEKTPVESAQTGLVTLSNILLGSVAIYSFIAFVVVICLIV